MELPASICHTAKKHALVVGCNYRGKANIDQLFGAINDARRNKWGQIISLIAPSCTMLSELGVDLSHIFEAILSHHFTTHQLQQGGPIRLSSAQQVIETFCPENISALFRAVQPADLFPKPLGPEQGILLAGCQVNEKSKEVALDDEGRIISGRVYVIQ